MPGTHRTSVILEIKPGESIRVSDVVTIQLLHKSGHFSRLRITAPQDMSIKKRANEDADVVTSMAPSEPS